MPISDLRYSNIINTSMESQNYVINSPGTASEIQTGLSCQRCPLQHAQESHQIEHALQPAGEELVPGSEAISSAALPVTFKQITEGSSCSAPADCSCCCLAWRKR